MSWLSHVDSFSHFDHSKLMLAKFYHDGIAFEDQMTLVYELRFHNDNERKDEIFLNF